MGVLVPNEIACKDLVELVTAYLEDGLDLADRTRFEMHLCICDACRAYLHQLRQVRRAAGKLAEESLPPESREVLLAAFRAWKGASGEGSA